jgi:WD40 repeat protein
MSRMAVFLTLVFTPTLCGADPVPRLDFYGDPLPVGAIARLGTLRYRPGTSPGAFALSPDGKLIATGESGWLRLWDTASGAQIRASAIPGAPTLESLQFSADGKRLAVHSQGQHRPGLRPPQFLCVVDVPTGQVALRLPEERSGFARVRISADGKYLVGHFGSVAEVDSEKDNSVHVWDVASGKDVNRFPPVENIELAPDGRTIALAHANGSIAVCDLLTGKERCRLKGHGDPILGLAFGPGGRLLVSSSGRSTLEQDKDRSLRIWDVAAAKELQRCTGFKEAVWRVKVAPDERHVAAEDLTGTLRLIDVATGKTRHVLPDVAPMSCAFAPDGKSLVFGSALTGVLHQWDIAAGKELNTWGGKQGLVRDIAIMPDGKRLVSSGNGLCLWDLSTGQEVWPFEAHRLGVRRLEFSPDGRLLLSIDNDQAVRLWNAQTGRPLPPFTADRLDRAIRARFAADGKILTTVGPDGMVRVWDPAAGWLVRQFPVGTADTVVHVSNLGNPEHSYNLSDWGAESGGLAFSPDGRLLAILDSDNVIRLWNVATGMKVHEWFKPRVYFDRLVSRVQFDRLAFSGDGRYLLARGDDLHVWDVSSGREMGKFPIPGGGGLFATSSDGKLLVLATQASTDLWDLDTQRKRFALGVGGARSIRFNQNGSLFAMADSDAWLRTWSTAAGKLDRIIEKRIWFERAVNNRLLVWVSGGSGLGEGLVDVDSGRRFGPFRGAVPCQISPDGRILVTGGETVKLHEWASGGLIGELPAGHRGPVEVMAFSPDGRRLATGSSDTSIVLWDWSRAAGLRTRPAGATALQGLWADLADPDAGKAYRAVFALAAREQSAAFLRERLRPATARDAEPIRALIADLDAGQFETREKAFQELLKLGAEAVPIVQEALTKKRPLEVTRRLEIILARPDATRWPPESLRKMRAVHALELAATPEARRLLETLAGGTAEAWLTREARQALQRLN